MNTLYTKDLIEERDDLKEQILDSFLDTFEHYADQTQNFDDILLDEEEIQDWKADWEDELKAIEEIDDLEDEICNGGGGCTLDNFQTLCKKCYNI